MHLLNRKFWEYCVQKYPKYFIGPNHDVLEVGSYNVNGSVRDYFVNFDSYTGVDWRPGPGVDMVCFAHDMSFDKKFDTIISASMLEHDRHWQKSLTRMIELLKDDGILLLSWGAALNPPHEHDTADDGCFHALPAGLVIKFLNELGVHVHEFRYEGLHHPQFIKRKPHGKGREGLGEVCLVAFKDKKYSIGDQHLDKLLPEDDV